MEVSYEDELTTFAVGSGPKYKVYFLQSCCVLLANIKITFKRRQRLKSIWLISLIL